MTQESFVDTNPKYWDKYTNPQRVKHELIRRYLNGWLPKLGYWAGRIVYIDTHAGRGTHRQGELGSPLVALKTFLDHGARDQILERSEVVFWFIEGDEDNLKSLDKQIDRFQLPPNVEVYSESGDCFPILRDLIESLKSEGKQLAPAFIFVDPYGFSVPGNVLRELMQFPRVELFVNVIWRELDMGLAQGDKHPGMADRLNSIFDGPSWRSKITAKDFDVRADQTINAFKEMLQAKWATPIRVLGKNNMTRYILVHYTNHDAGLDLMKDCIWKVCPGGNFCVKKEDDSNQLRLFSEDPNLDSLKKWICGKLHERPHRWQEFHELIQPLIWRNPHVNEAIGNLRKDGVITVSDERSFTIKANPLLSLVQ